MIGSSVGPYKILSELGAGGMGTVYLAEAPDGGGRLAVKIVHPHLIATPGFFKRFLREAELGRKVTHENVVRTLDVDATMVADKQVNYMVMEYVEGKSLRGLLRDLGTVPEALVREIALQAANGLASIHKADIVHRDLKPENILITDDQRIRIMDLGVAKLQEASIAITKEGQFAGSLLYAAPEQFGKGAIGPASDLYSLGVLLYELATGQNPFREDDAASVIQAHLTFDPPRACERNPDVSLFLSEVIATLIAKAPGDRFDSADTLRKLLEQGEASEWWIERAQRLHALQSHLPRIPVPRETALHARDGDLRTLHEAWEKAKRGEGSTILFEGEAGIGKTRLLDEFVRSLEKEDCHALYGSYPPSGGLGGMSEAIIQKFGEAGLAQALRPYLTVTPSLVPAFAALLKHESAPTGSEPLRGDALSTVTCHLLRSLSEEKPTLWIIDDLHFAPSEGRHLLLSMARHAGALRVLILMTARPGLPDEDVAHLTRLPIFRRIALSRLGARDVIELLRDAFRSGVLAEKLGGKIAYKSDGVPLFVFEMIRALKESRLITQRADGSYVQTKLITEIDVPSAVKDLIEARLNGLTKEQRAILDVGAVQGMSFEPTLVAAVLEEKKVRVLQEIAEIERRFGLVKGEATSCRFDQNQIHEVVYHGILPELRAEYHTMLADARGEKGDPTFLAYHHLRGSRPEAAQPYVTPALHRLAADYRNEALLELADRALAAEGLFEGEERCALLIRKATTCADMGEYALSLAALEGALPLADAAGTPAQRVAARSSMALILAQRGRCVEAQRIAEECVANAREWGDDTLVARASGMLGLILSDFLGYYAKGLPLLTFPNHRGLALQYLGRYAEARAAFETTVAESRASKDRIYEGIGLVNLGRLQAACGDPVRGRGTLEEARVILRAIGQRRPEGYALHRLGVVAEQMGDSAEAERLFEAALSLRREIEYLRGIADTLLALGRLRGARELLAEANKIARAIDRPDVIVGSAVCLGDGAEEALQAYGDRLRVLDRMKATFALWESSGRAGLLEEAHRLHRHLLENAPEECREAMVQNVPVHRAVATAWRDRT
ncbi:MAG: serine/threonine-protein kinase [Planctomycetaceae bacterium]